MPQTAGEIHSMAWKNKGKATEYMAKRRLARRTCWGCGDAQAVARLQAAPGLPKLSLCLLCKSKLESRDKDDRRLRALLLI